MRTPSPKCKACGCNYNLCGPIEDGDEEFYLCGSCADDDNPYSDKEMAEYLEYYEKELEDGKTS